LENILKNIHPQKQTASLSLWSSRTGSLIMDNSSWKSGGLTYHFLTAGQPRMSICQEVSLPLDSRKYMAVDSQCVEFAGFTGLGVAVVAAWSDRKYMGVDSLLF
jgi:hypothetical protein